MSLIRYLLPLIGFIMILIGFIMILKCFILVLIVCIMILINFLMILNGFIMILIGGIMIYWFYNNCHSFEKDLELFYHDFYYLRIISVRFIMTLMSVMMILICFLMMLICGIRFAMSFTMISFMISVSVRGLNRAFC